MIHAPTDRELWEASCLTRYQLEHWTDADLAAHAKGVRHTIKHLLSLLGAEPTPEADAARAAPTDTAA